MGLFELCCQGPPSKALWPGARLLSLSLDCCYLAGLLLFIGPAATMITTDSPPGSPTSPQKLQKEMAFKRDFRISQFQRELKLQLVAKAAAHAAAGAVAAPAEAKKKKWDVVLERRRKNTPKRLERATKQPPKKLFDADATLRILVDVSRDVAAGKATAAANELLLASSSKVPQSAPPPWEGGSTNPLPSSGPSSSS